MKPKMTQLETISLQANILEKLRIGHKNAIGLKDLCKKLDANERKLRLAIEALRNEGYLILFGQKTKTKDTAGNKIILPNGYYLCETPQEAIEFYEYMKSRVIEECKIMRSIKLAAHKKFNKTFGQLPLMPL
jgi:hypothetical protein